jgi:putative spermidine/putrescine transport system substrate-binding protein
MMNLKPEMQSVRLPVLFWRLRLAFAIVLSMAAGTVVRAQAPAEPITLNIVDVGGALALLQTAMESYSLHHPNVKFTFKKAIAVELPKTLGAAPTEVDLVLGGTDILAAGIDKELWVTLLPNHAAKFPGLMDRYLSEARRMQAHKKTGPSELRQVF